MNSPDDWDSLINQSLGSKSGDVPNKTGPDSAILGTKESRFYAASRPISPKSPESPTKKQGRGNSETLDARAGSVVEQFNCDKNTDWVIIVKASEWATNVASAITLRCKFLPGSKTVEHSTGDVPKGLRY